jgi:TIGR03009 family protein
MRCRWLSLTALLLAGVVALAQQPPGQLPPAPQPPVLDPVNNKLDGILVKWEQAMTSINTLHAQVKRTAVNKVLISTDVFEGEAKYLKPNKASLWLVNSKKAQEFERLVCNGQIAYKWEPLTKEIHIHTMPQPKQGQIGDDNFVSMLFGMKALEAKRRYDLTLLPPPPNDTYYHYIQVLPRDNSDKVEFTRARLVLTISTHLPRQIWFEESNGNETTWDFPKMAANAQIDPREFGEPVPPAGWQLKRVALQEQPRVVRPQQH